VKDGEPEEEDPENENQDPSGVSEDEEPSRRRRKSTRKPKKRGRLAKLKDLIKAVGLSNPRFYQALKKAGSERQQILHIEEILDEKEIAHDAEALSREAMEETKKKYALQKELNDLGDTAKLITTNGRGRRARKKVNYVDNLSEDEKDGSLTPTSNWKAGDEGESAGDDGSDFEPPDSD